jgi:hypothetical protein
MRGASPYLSFKDKMLFILIGYFLFGVGVILVSPWEMG